MPTKVASRSPRARNIIDEPPLAGGTLRFMQQVWSLAHALHVRSKHMARTLGVTGPQRLVVRLVGQHPDASPTELSRMLGVHPSTMTGVLARLEARGILKRLDHASDRRRRRFRLTARGRRVDKHRAGTVEEAVDRTLIRSSHSMITSTERMLRMLIAELEA